MKTNPMAGRGGFGIAALVLVGALLSGCATSGGNTGGGAKDAPTAAALAERDFYADWYDSTAVVFPPPPAATARR